MHLSLKEMSQLRSLIFLLSICILPCKVECCLNCQLSGVIEWAEQAARGCTAADTAHPNLLPIAACCEGSETVLLVQGDHEECQQTL